MRTSWGLPAVGVQGSIPGPVLRGAGTAGKAQAGHEPCPAQKDCKRYTSPPVNCFSCSAQCRLEHSGTEWLILAR